MRQGGSRRYDERLAGSRVGGLLEGPAVTCSEILTRRLWSYRAATFRNEEALFHTQLSQLPNPPDFTEASDHNVMIPGLSCRH